jgi:hypothetical protein
MRTYGRTRGPYGPAPADPVLSRRGTDRSARCTARRSRPWGEASAIARIVGRYVIEGAVAVDWFAYRPPSA